MNASLKKFKLKLIRSGAERVKPDRSTRKLENSPRVESEEINRAVATASAHPRLMNERHVMMHQCLDVMGSAKKPMQAKPHKITLPFAPVLVLSSHSIIPVLTIKLENPRARSRYRGNNIDNVNAPPMYVVVSLWPPKGQAAGIERGRHAQA
jgi:hypothetical protein